MRLTDLRLNLKKKKFADVLRTILSNISCYTFLWSNLYIQVKCFNIFNTNIKIIYQLFRLNDSDS